MKFILLLLRVGKKNKLGYIISIFSLTLGFCIYLLVSRFIQAENNYDTGHSGYENSYRLTFHTKTDGAEFGDAVVQFPVADQLRADYPGIESTLRIYRSSALPLLQNETIKFAEDKLLFADSNFFSFFAFPLIKGDYRTALNQANSVVLTQKAISKYFGNTDPMGKTLLLDGKHPLTVTGIVDDTKIRSHIKFDVLIPLTFQLNLWRAEGKSKDTQESWLITLSWAYVKFKDNSQKVFVENDLQSFVKKYFPDTYKNRASLALQPLTEIHTSSHFDTEIAPNVSDAYLNIFKYIIVAILIFSTINFINLNTSILLNRAKEFSMKGILGSSKLHLFGEIFTSTLSIAFISLLLSICVSITLQSYFNTQMETQLEPISLIGDWTLLLSSFGFIMLISLIGSIQPYLVMISGSYLGTIRDVKGVSAIMRKIGVGAQIACSFVLIFGTLIIFKQIGFMMTFDLGFNKENIIVLPVRESIDDHYEAFKNEIKNIPSVKNMTWTTDVPGIGGVSNYRFVPQGIELDKPIFLPMVQVDYDFIETMDIKMKDGREFDPSLPGDVGQTYIVNQAFIDKMDWKNEYLGKEIQMYKPRETFVGNKGKVIGKVDDFHMKSLHFPVDPLIIALKHAFSHPGSYVIKVESVNAETLNQIEQVWKNFEHEWPFEYKLLNLELNRLYENESKLFSLTLILSILAILISFFGLFGINSVSILKKYKPIAIKKVLGAHSGIIFKEAMKGEFTFLAFVFVIAAPIAYFTINSWLEGFQYKTQISFVDFIETVALITFLVFGTLFYHLLKMAATNPLKHIKRE